MYVFEVTLNILLIITSFFYRLKNIPNGSIKQNKKLFRELSSALHSYVLMLNIIHYITIAQSIILFEV